MKLPAFIAGPEAGPFFGITLEYNVIYKNANNTHFSALPLAPGPDLGYARRSMEPDLQRYVPKFFFIAL